MYDDLKALEEAYMAGEITWEEYRQRILETEEYYKNQLIDIDYLYFTALTGSGEEAYAIISDSSGKAREAALEDSKLAEEAWSGKLELMSKSAEDIMTATSNYLFGNDGNGGTLQLFTKFAKDMESIQVSLNLDSITGVKTEVDKVTGANDELAKNVNETLLPAPYKYSAPSCGLLPGQEPGLHSAAAPSVPGSKNTELPTEPRIARP